MIYFNLNAWYNIPRWEGRVLRSMNLSSRRSEGRRFCGLNFFSFQTASVVCYFGWQGYRGTFSNRFSFPTVWSPTNCRQRWQIVATSHCKNTYAGNSEGTSNFNFNTLYSKPHYPNPVSTSSTHVECLAMTIQRIGVLVRFAIAS